MLLFTYGSSEYAWLSDDDLYRLTAEIAAVVAGRSCFITSSSVWPAKVCAGFLRHAERAGVDAVKVQINMWAMAGAGAHRADLLRTYFDEAGAGSSIPLLLWCNSAGGEPLPVDLVAELAALDRVVGLKNDDHPFYYYYDLCRATQDLDFAVLSGGQMRNFVLGYQMGSTGYLCTMAPGRRWPATRTAGWPPRRRSAGCGAARPPSTSTDCCRPSPALFAVGDNLLGVLANRREADAANLRVEKLEVHVSYRP